MIADWMKHFGGCKWLTRGGDIVQTARGDGGKVKHLFGNASHSWWSDGQRFANAEDPGDLIAPAYEWIHLPALSPLPTLPDWVRVKADLGENRGFIGTWRTLPDSFALRRIMALEPDPNNRPIDLSKPAGNIEWRPSVAMPPLFVPQGLSNEQIQKLMDTRCGPIEVIPGRIEELEATIDGLSAANETLRAANAEVRQANQDMARISCQKDAEIDRLKKALASAARACDTQRGDLANMGDQLLSVRRDYDARIAILTAANAGLQSKLERVAELLETKR